MISINMAIHSLYPQVASTAGDDAFDAQGNKFEYDVDAVNAEVIRLQTEEAAKEQQLIANRQSALAKLMALGLTEEEALALGVK
jgi:Rieske Fe-S protein